MSTEELKMPARPERQRHCLRRKRVVIPIVAVIVLGVGLGVGLGIGLKNREQSEQAQCTTVGQNPVHLSTTPPNRASQPVAEAFLSYAIEFSSFPLFAGNLSNPNIYSDNLLNNIGNLTGTKPYVRVGGNSQDLSVFEQNFDQPVSNKIDSGSDVPSGLSEFIELGTSFFESYQTWPNVRFIHGFNMQLAALGDVNIGYNNLEETIPLACKALSGGKLLWWEYGNEANLFTSTPSMNARSALDKRNSVSWSDSSYVSQWQNGTDYIQSILASTSGCEDMASGDEFGFIAPSFWQPADTALSLSGSWNDGLDSNGTVKLISMHIYQGNGEQGNPTIASTMLNHSAVTSSISTVVSQYEGLQTNNKPPLIISETNSLYDTGVDGVTNTFAAALWSLDYILWCATQNVTRIHLQQGDKFKYNSWQPRSTSNAPIGTLPAYYGNMAAAAALGNSASSEVQVSTIRMGGGGGSDGSDDVAYATYQDGNLARLTVMNLREWNSSSTTARGDQTYSFSIPGGSGTASIQRLLGPGSDSESGISWDGNSYDVQPNNGMAAAMNGVITGEQFLVCNGSFSVTVQDSSAAVIHFGSY